MYDLGDMWQVKKTLTRPFQLALKPGSHAHAGRRMQDPSRCRRKARSMEGESKEIGVGKEGSGKLEMNTGAQAVLEERREPRNNRWRNRTAYAARVLGPLVLPEEEIPSGHDFSSV